MSERIEDYCEVVLEDLGAATILTLGIEELEAIEGLEVKDARD